jgi:large conductance mechanosensitive channel
MRGIADEFKQFLLRGNVVDLAVAVVLGAAFGAVVTSFVENLVTPLIAAIGGQPNFSEIDFTINGSTFGIGLFLNALISFVIIAAVIFFFVVKPMNVLIERSRKQAPTDPSLRKCPSCLSDVPIAATRCAYCTSDLPEAQPHELVAPA